MARVARSGAVPGAGLWRMARIHIFEPEIKIIARKPVLGSAQAAETVRVQSIGHGERCRGADWDAWRSDGWRSRSAVPVDGCQERGTEMKPREEPNVGPSRRVPAILVALALLCLSGCATAPLYGTYVGRDSYNRPIYEYCTNGGKCLKSYSPSMPAFTFYYLIQQQG